MGATQQFTAQINQLKLVKLIGFSKAGFEAGQTFSLK